MRTFSHVAGLASTVILGALFLSATSARAQAVYEYAPSATGAYSGVAIATDGGIRYSEYGTSEIGEFKSGHTVLPLVTPTLDAGPDSMALGPDGNIWFLELKAGKLARINPDRSITEEPLPCSPSAALYNSGDALWFAEQCRGYEELVRVAPGGSLSHYVISSGNAVIWGIVKGPDGNIWFTEFGSNKIGRLDLSGPYLTEFAIPTAVSEPSFIVLGGDGKLWFQEDHPPLKVASIDIAHGGLIVEYDWPDTVLPQTLIAGADGNFWTIDAMKRVWRFSIDDGAVNRIQIPSKQNDVMILGIALAANGDIWFSEDRSSGGNSALGLIRMDGIFNDDLEPPLP